MGFLAFIGLCCVIFWFIKIMASIGWGLLKGLGILILCAIFGWNIGALALVVYICVKIIGRN